MIEKAAKGKRESNFLKITAVIAARARKILTPVATFSAYVGSAILGSLVLMLIYTVFARRVFNAPLKGSLVLTALALGVITFLVLAFESLKGESMIVEIVVDRFPGKARSIIGIIIYFLSAAILGVLCWRLILQGINVYGYHQTTATLTIPLFPFIFLAAFGVLLLTLVYILHFIESLNKLGEN
jgi:TRAP-type transport system small permease protein